MPQWNTISISGYHIREAGSTAAQELAFTLANGMEYVRRGVAAGMDVDTFAPRLSFFFDSHLDFFEEISKFRAARRIWARKMREEFGAKDPRSWMLRFHTQTAGVSLTAQQPENNIVRTAFEALRRGPGWDAVAAHELDGRDATRFPPRRPSRSRLRTQQVLAEETEVANVTDPARRLVLRRGADEPAGRGGRGLLRGDRARGGVVPCVEAGWIQREIHRSAVTYQRAVEAGTKRVVGVNCYVEEDESGSPRSTILRIDPSVEVEQRKRLKDLRAAR